MSSGNKADYIRSMYQLRWPVITPDDARAIWLFIPSLDTCFWHNTPKIVHDPHAILIIDVCVYRKQRICPHYAFWSALYLISQTYVDRFLNSRMNIGWPLSITISLRLPWVMGSIWKITYLWHFRTGYVMHFSGTNVFGWINALGIEWNGGRLLTTFSDMAIFWKEIFSWWTVSIQFIDGHMCYQAPICSTHAVCDKCWQTYWHFNWYNSEFEWISRKHRILTISIIFNLQYLYRGRKSGRPFRTASEIGRSPYLVAVTWKYKKLV